MASRRSTGFHQQTENGTVSDAEGAFKVQLREDLAQLPRFKHQALRSGFLGFGSDKRCCGVIGQPALRQARSQDGFLILGIDNLDEISVGALPVFN